MMSCRRILFAVLLLAGLGVEANFVVSAPQAPGQPATTSSADSSINGGPSTSNEKQTPRIVGNPFREPTNVRRAGTPIEALRATMSESELKYFFERAVFDAEDPALIKVLDFFPRLGRPNIEHYAKLDRNVPLSEAVADPSTYGAQVFNLRGTVTRCVKQKIFPSVAEAFDFEHFYIVSMKLVDHDVPALVCARHVPSAWLEPEDASREISAGCLGMFLQVVESAENVIRPVFVADRMEWYPTAEDAALHVKPAHVFLAQHGFDVGLFEDVSRQNNTDSLPGEPIYQLFKSLNQVAPEELSDLSEGKLDLAAALQKPATLHGRVFWVRGSARRVQEVKGDQSGQLVERFGIDHYYAIDMFIPLSSPIELSQKEGGKPVKYEAHFPATVYVLRLPDGMATGGETNYEIQVPCVFFKLWAYPSKYVEAKSGGLMQPAPLLMGIEPQLVNRNQGIGSSTAAVLVGLFALILGSIWFFLWRAGRRDDEFKHEQLKRRFDRGGTLKDMEIEENDQPNFDSLP